MKKSISFLLSLCLGLFLAAGAVSLLDDSLVLLFNFHILTAISAILAFFALFIVLLVYGLMGFIPNIPKRVVLPVILFCMVVLLVIFPALIYYYDRILQIDWVISLCQVIVVLGIVYWLQGGLKFHWFIVEDKYIGDRRFSWLHLSVFLLVNIFVLLPAMISYVLFCATLAVDHFSGGFLAMHPGGLTVQVRKYVRNDGKTIELIPMAHVADAGFYRKVSQLFPTNSIILMEGVTDRNHLLTNEISYKRMATSLGLAEQGKEFVPQGKIVMADVDVEQFSTNTIELLNLVMLIHSKGVNPETIQKVLEYSQPPNLLEQITSDLLRKRNRHLLEEIRAWLPQSENLVVPWGVAHIPEIGKEIQKCGFRLSETREYTIIRFHFVRKYKLKAGK